MADYQHIKGLAELAAKLHALPDKLAKKHLAGAMVAGAAVIRDEARTLAPVYTGPVSQGHPPPGTLRRAVILKRIPERSSRDRQVVYVVVRHGKKFSRVFKKKKGVLQASVNLDAFYWRFVEFGTAKMAARPFMRPAFEAKKRAAVEVIAARLRAGMEEIAAEKP